MLFFRPKSLPKIPMTTASCSRFLRANTNSSGTSPPDECLIWYLFSGNTVEYYSAQDSLIAFVRAAQMELVWVSEREEIEVTRNWSDIKQLDLPMLTNYYKQVHPYYFFWIMVGLYQCQIPFSLFCLSLLFRDTAAAAVRAG